MNYIPKHSKWHVNVMIKSLWLMQFKSVSLEVRYRSMKEYYNLMYKLYKRETEKTNIPTQTT